MSESEDETLRELLDQAKSLNQRYVGTMPQVVMPPPTEGERAVHRVEKYFVAMVVLNVCFGAAMALNWITDKNQDYVINAIYMMAPGLQQQIEARKEAIKP